MNCVNYENSVVKPMKFDWIVWIMKIFLLNPWNLIELCEWWKCCCLTHESWMNYGNDDNVVVKPWKIFNCVNDENSAIKPVKIDWFVEMMKMLLLNPWNLIKVWGW